MFVSVCLSVRGMQVAPKQIKGLVLAFLSTPPPTGTVVCEIVTLGAVGCGVVGVWGALVWGVWLLGLGCVGVCVVFRAVGQMASINSPRQTSPTQRKPQSNLASGLVYVVSTPHATPPPPRAPTSPQNTHPPSQAPKCTKGMHAHLGRVTVYYAFFFKVNILIGDANMCRLILTRATMNI